jgi:hypothetical protein
VDEEGGVEQGRASWAGCQPLPEAIHFSAAWITGKKTLGAHLSYCTSVPPFFWHSMWLLKNVAPVAYDE